MRSREELQRYADEIDSDPQLVKMIEKLLEGAERLRNSVEAACDRVDRDLEYHAEGN
jgi:hypothetical protein